MQKLAPIAAPLLEWYHRHRRILPFRENPTPYHIWVSEIMLQQTRVSTVLPYYERFISRLPDISTLSACDEETLHKLWQGLGYYSRVRNMQKATQIVVEQHGGQLPASREALLALPGIGAYTAGAILSIAYGLPHVAVDGNVLRVFSRLLNSEADIALPATKQAMAEVVQKQQPQNAPGDFNQALMELGALVCLPGSPACGECPLAGLCLGYRAGSAASLPRKTPPKPKREIPVCLLLVRSGNRILLQKRPAKGLLAGLWQPVLWEGTFTPKEAAARLAGLLPAAKMGKALPTAAHAFTHRVWRMYGWQASVAEGALAPEDYAFATAQEIDEGYPLPGAFKAYLPLIRGVTQTGI